MKFIQRNIQWFGGLFLICSIAGAAVVFKPRPPVASSTIPATTAKASCSMEAQTGQCPHHQTKAENKSATEHKAGCCAKPEVTPGSGACTRPK
jgi:hypothetical protein